MNSPVHLTEDERAEAREMIRKGELPPDALERQAESEAKNVFGADAKRDKNGKFIEQGIGSKNHESLNHFTALLRAEQQGFEPAGTYNKAVADLWKPRPEARGGDRPAAAPDRSCGVRQTQRPI